jgi:hypothetical protein
MDFLKFSLFVGFAFKGRDYGMVATHLVRLTHCSSWSSSIQNTNIKI